MIKGTEVGKILVQHGIKVSDFVDKDENVRILNLIEKLDENGVGKDEFLTLFGQDYGKYLIALRGLSGDLRKVVRNLDGESFGLGRRVASVYMQGAQGAMNSFKASGEALMLSVADSGLLEDFTDATNFLARQMRAASEISPGTLRAGTLAMGGIAAGGAGLLGMGLLSKLISGSLSGIAGTFTARQVFMAMLKGGARVAGPVGVTLTFAELIDSWIELNKEEITDSLDSFESWLTKMSKERNSEIQRLISPGTPRMRESYGNMYQTALNWFTGLRAYNPPENMWARERVNFTSESGISLLDYSKFVPEFLTWDGNLDRATHPGPLPLFNSPANLVPQYELQRREGFILNPFGSRYEFKPDYRNLKPGKKVITTPLKSPEEQKVTFDFKFDNVPEDLNIEVSAPRKLRINKEVRHRFGGLYG